MPNERSDTSAGRILIYAAAMACGVLLLMRLSHGVDFTDESMYVATARRFALGASPLVHDLDAHQLAGWLMSPVVWIYLRLLGSTHGIVLFMRVVFVAGFAGAVLAVPRRQLGIKTPYAVIAAMTAIMATPFLIFAPSYNTLGALLAALGVNLLFRGTSGSGRANRALLACAATSMVLACVAYIAFIPLALVSPFLLWAMSGRQRASVYVYLGAAAAVAAGVLAVLSPGLQHLGRVAAYNLTLAQYYGWGGGFDKVTALLRGAGEMATVTPAIWVAGAIVTLRLFRRIVPGWLVILAVVLLPVMKGPLPLWGLHFSTAVLLVALATYAPRRGAASAWPILFAATLASAATMYTSSNGFMAAGIGAWGFLPLTVAVCIQAGAAAVAKYSLPARVRVAAALSLCLLPLAVSTAVGLTSAYNDVGILQATHRIDKGPWAGLSTDAVAYQFANELEAQLEGLGSDHYVFAFDEFPSAYLIGDARPASPQLWISRGDETMPSLAEPIVTEVASHADHGVLILQSHAADYSGQSMVAAGVLKEAVLMKSTPFFEVYRLGMVEQAK